MLLLCHKWSTVCKCYSSNKYIIQCSLFGLLRLFYLKMERKIRIIIFQQLVVLLRADCDWKIDNKKFNEIDLDKCDLLGENGYICNCPFICSNDGNQSKIAPCYVATEAVSDTRSKVLKVLHVI